MMDDHIILSALPCSFLVASHRQKPGRFGWSFLLVTPCLTSASSIIQQLFEKGGACKQHPLIVPMVFDANLEFEFLSLSSMNSDSEFSFGLFCVVLNL